MIDWRSSRADSLESDVAQTAFTIATCWDWHELADSHGEDAACHEVRAVIATMKSLSVDWAAHARELRTVLGRLQSVDPAELDLFAATTTRHVRRLAP